MSQSDRKAEGDRAVAAREAAGSAPGRARTTRGVWTAGSIDTQQTIYFLPDQQNCWEVLTIRWERWNTRKMARK